MTARTPRHRVLLAVLTFLLAIFACTALLRAQEPAAAQSHGPAAAAVPSPTRARVRLIPPSSSAPMELWCTREN